MEMYPLDIDPQQVVRWIMAETKAAPAIFTINARRAADVQNIPVRQELHFGDEEREDLREVSTTATLEIAPAHAKEGWRLIVAVEDEAGPRAINAPSDEQQMDLGSFYHEFIRPGRGTANIVAEVEGPAARTRLNRLLEAIETNRPHPDRKVSRQ
jgi:hypothetical protein